MDGARRNAYLRAMGITPWQRRVPAGEVVESPTEPALDSGAAALDTVAATGDAAAGEIPATAAPVAGPGPAPIPPPAAAEPFGPASAPARSETASAAALPHEHEASHLPAWLLTRPLASLGESAVIGPPQAPLLLVEAPLPGGQPPALCGGDAGRLLARMLAAIGLSRRDVRNAVLADERAQTASSLAEYLAAQSGCAQPLAVLLLIELPAAASGAALEHLRGQLPPLPSASASASPGSGSALLVSHHPAWLLRQPAAKRQAWDDLQRLRNMLGAR